MIALPEVSLSIKTQTHGGGGAHSRYICHLHLMSGTSLEPSLQAGFLRGGDGEGDRARELWVTEEGPGWEEQRKEHLVDMSF